MRTLVLLALSVLTPGLALGQDAIGTGVEYVPQARVSQDEETDGSQEVGLLRSNLDFAYRIFENTTTTLVAGIGYRGRFPDAESELGDVVDPFHELAVRGVVIYRFSDAWSVFGQLAPMLTTDFKEVDRDHFRLSGAGLVGYRFDDKLDVALGVAISYVFGVLQPLPAVRLDWKIAESVRLNAVFPGHALIGWRTFERLEVGVMSRLAGNRFRVTGDLLPGLEQLVYTQADASAFIDVRLAGPLWLSFRGGHTFYRKLVLLDESGESLVDGGSIANAPVFGLSLVVRPRFQSDSPVRTRSLE